MWWSLFLIKLLKRSHHQGGFSVNILEYIWFSALLQQNLTVSHKFLILALKKYRFGKTFIKRIKTLLNNQESCIINGGFTTKYFKLDKGTRQGDPMSPYFFILVLEIIFNIIKQNKDIHGLSFFDHTFLYTAHVDDSTFFLKDKESVKKVIDVLIPFLSILV